MQENHNDQPLELTYPVEIQFTDPNETNTSDQPMEQDSDREPATEPSIRWENITFVGKAAAQDIGLSERRILTGLLLLKSSRS